MILVLDRNPVFRQGLCCVVSMQAKGKTVVQVESISDALMHLSGGEVEAVFCDVRLNNEDGMDLVRDIKERFCGVKTFILTESLRKIDFNLAVKLNVDAYVKKDATIEEIHYAMKTVDMGRKYYSSDFVSMLNSNEDDSATTSLTNRETDVLAMLFTGLSNAEISRRLCISEGTTKKHVSNILGKLGLTSRSEAIVYANKHRYVMSGAFKRLHNLMIDERMTVNA